MTDDPLEKMIKEEDAIPGGPGRRAVGRGSNTLDPMNRSQRDVGVHEHGDQEEGVGP